MVQMDHGAQKNNHKPADLWIWTITTRRPSNFPIDEHRQILSAQVFQKINSHDRDPPSQPAKRFITGYKARKKPSSKNRLIAFDEHVWNDLFTQSLGGSD